MKSKFDYPTCAETLWRGRACAQTKAVANEGKRYQQYLKQEREEERMRVREEMAKKEEKEKLQAQHRLRAELQKKKNQLMLLELQKSQAIECERKAYEMAAIKQEQDQIKAIEKLQKNKRFEEAANLRFNHALRRLGQEKQEQSIKEKQAQRRRKIQQEKQQIQRQKAIKYQSFQQKRYEQEKKMPERRKAVGRQTNFLGSKGVNYSQTWLHNPSMQYNPTIKANVQPQDNLQQTLQKEERRREQASLEKKEREQMERKKSVERGRRATEHIFRKKQYDDYCRETEQQQIQYNLRRLEAGKRNQFTGMKPLTLQQMENQKKIRAEQEFQKMFGNTKWTHVDRYTVVEQKMAPNIAKNQNKQRYVNENKSSAPHSLIKSYTDSLNPAAPSQRYSFEQEEPQQPPQQHISEKLTLGEGVPQIISQYNKNKERQEELNYSVSQEEDSNME